MKKKIIFISIVAMLLMVAITIVKVSNPLNFGINPLKTALEQRPLGKILEISFSYTNVALVASSQYAFWIEDMDGNYVDTLYVTRYTSKEGHRRRPNSIPKWVSASRIADMRNSEIDSISGATPKTGHYFVYWDFTDNNGNIASDAEYRYFIEASVMNDDTAIYSGIIKVEDKTWEEQPIPKYSNLNSEYNAMLSDVRVAYYPN